MKISDSRRLFLFTAIVCLAGCGGEASENSLNRQVVSVQVTLDASPLSHGSIEFHPSEQSGGVTISGGSIENGLLSLTTKNGLPPGNYKVIIYSTPPPVNFPSDPNAAMEAAGKPPQKVVNLHQKYNSQTELTCEITEGENELLFKLSSSP